LGSLASELANDSEPARKRLAESFSMWGDRIERGLVKMQERGELAASANPHDPVSRAAQRGRGRAPSAKTAQLSRPLEIALDMAIDHVARHVTARPETPKSGRR